MLTQLLFRYVCNGKLDCKLFLWRAESTVEIMCIIHKNDCPVHLYTSAIYSVTAFYFQEITS